MDAARVGEIELAGARLSLIASKDLVDRVVAEAARGGRGYVCIANVHQVTHAWQDPAFRQTLREAKWVSTDSRVLQLALAALGHRYSSDVTYGVDLLEAICAKAARSGVKVGLFGGSPALVRRMESRLRKVHPDLDLGRSTLPASGRRLSWPRTPR